MAIQTIWSVDLGKSSLKAVKLRRAQGHVEIAAIDKVDYSTSGFSALPGQDYLEVAGTLSWADGDASGNCRRCRLFGE